MTLKEILGFAEYFNLQQLGDQKVWYITFDRNNCQSVMFFHLLSDNHTVRLSVSENSTGVPFEHLFDFEKVDLLETYNVTPLITFIHLMNLK